jgi:hypothetical protein
MIDAYPSRPLHDWVRAHRDEIGSLLRPEDEPGYSDDIKAGRCEDAEAIVARRFGAAFPEMACFFRPPTVLVPNSAMTWRIYVATHAYPDLRLCFAESGLRNNLAVLKKAGLPPPKAVWPDDMKALERAYGRFWGNASRIDSALADMDMGCRLDGHLPSCVAFARVANEGVIVKKTNDFLYFYVVRIRLAGFDSAERQRLEKEIGARLTPEARALNEARARESLAGVRQFPQAFPQDRYPGVPEPSDD